MNDVNDNKIKPAPDSTKQQHYTYSTEQICPRLLQLASCQAEVSAIPQSTRWTSVDIDKV